MSRTIVLHLSLIPDVGPACVERIGNALGKNLASLYDMSVHDVMIFCDLNEIIAQKVVNGLADEKLLADECERIEKHAISWATRGDHDYPELLKYSYLPPSVLYWRGEAPRFFSQALAVVGSRQAHAYAKRVLEYLIPELVTR